jgi:hypothetical protein
MYLSFFEGTFELAVLGLPFQLLFAAFFFFKFMYSLYRFFFIYGTAREGSNRTKGAGLLKKVCFTENKLFSNKGELGGC